MLYLLDTRVKVRLIEELRHSQTFQLNWRLTIGIFHYKKICILPVPVLCQDNGHHLQLQLKADPVLPALLLLPNLHPRVEVHPHMEVHPLPKLGPKELGPPPGWTTRPPLLASLKEWRSLTCHLHLRREEVSSTAWLKEILADSKNINSDFRVSSLENRSRNWTFSLTGKTSKCSCPPLMTKYHQIHLLSHHEVRKMFLYTSSLNYRRILSCISHEKMGST